MYCAPEIIAGTRYNTGVDVYSFAMTMFECVCGKRYIKQQYQHVGRKEVTTGWRPKPRNVLEEAHPLVWSLIQECWRSAKEGCPEHGGLENDAKSTVLAADHATRRPTFAEIVERLEGMQPLRDEAPAPTKMIERPRTNSRGMV